MSKSLIERAHHENCACVTDIEAQHETTQTDEEYEEDHQRCGVTHGRAWINGMVVGLHVLFGLCDVAFILRRVLMVVVTGRVQRYHVDTIAVLLLGLRRDIGEVELRRRRLEFSSWKFGSREQYGRRILYSRGLASWCSRSRVAV